MFRAAVTIFALAAAPASAANLAIFGSNNIATLYGASNSVTLVTDADLATAGFLSAFDAFVYTRDGQSLGNSLSVAAAANVKAFVTGRIVLFNGDFQDGVGEPGTDALFLGALAHVLGGSGKGYIGEFSGAFAAYGSNQSSLNPLGLLRGSVDFPISGLPGSGGEIGLTPAGEKSSVTAGTPFPFNAAAVQFSATISGGNPATVLGRFGNGNAAIIAAAGPAAAGVPEPGAWALMIIGFGAVGAAMRRRAAAATA